MITDSYTWKSLVSCFMCKRGHGRITPTAVPKIVKEEKESADSKINKLVILPDGGDAPIKNALDIPSNGISDDGSRMMPMESVAPDRGATNSDPEISTERYATATKTQTITVGAAESLFVREIPDDSQELSVERIERIDELSEDRTSKLPPIYKHLPQRRRPSTAVTVSSNGRPKSSGPYARISFIQEQRALASVNYRRERLEAT